MATEVMLVVTKGNNLLIETVSRCIQDNATAAQHTKCLRYSTHHVKYAVLRNSMCDKKRKCDIVRPLECGH